MKQRRWLSEFSCLSKYTRLYPNLMENYKPALDFLGNPANIKARFCVISRCKVMSFKYHNINECQFQCRILEHILNCLLGRFGFDMACRKV